MKQGANDDTKAAIERSRRAIDSIDDQIVILLEVRAKIAIEIGHRKRAAGVPLHDSAREAEILARIATRANDPLAGHSLQPIFEPIFELMRTIEARSTTNTDSRTKGNRP